MASLQFTRLSLTLTGAGTLPEATDGAAGLSFLLIGLPLFSRNGQRREWWHRLQNAFGTASSAFVAASLQQLIAAARLPNSGISEIAVNASLAFIEGAKPRDEIECALVIQMACTHSAAMAALD